ncbi:MAG: class I SAM-dependent RNA methyltransferase [Lachnospiraceae bacterium]|jgi:23S rRNA (uracil1939-C5)-methyltransferase|nr:class I SAM-dependent RNA methyltransferase [Lachnospiraceae bacterium]MEE3461473.1 class I SAM-dependent RNA methyltransferase [Lachnospiraceae bacterium]
MNNKKATCPYVKKCGGCSLINTPYEEQLELKQNTIEKLLAPILSKDGGSVEPVIGASDPYYYRNKVHSAFACVFERREDRNDSELPEKTRYENDPENIPDSRPGNKTHKNQRKKPRRKVIRGIYREGSHYVVDIKGCRLEDRTADSIIETIKKMLSDFRLTVYNEDTELGFLRHVLVRRGYRLVRSIRDGINENGSLHITGGKPYDNDSIVTIADQAFAPEYMVVLVTGTTVFPGKNNFIKALRQRFPQIVTIVQNINDRHTSMVLGERNIVLYGKGYVIDESLGLSFRIHPDSFYQINSLQTRKLYGLALNFAGLKGKENVLDAYCGTGTIGMFMAPHAGFVTGVELNRSAVRDAIANARTNNIKNIFFENADATRYLLELAEVSRRYTGKKSTKKDSSKDISYEGSEDDETDDKETPHIDVLCMDPPRAGSTEEFIRAAAALSIPRIVYVSCEPTTLARDLKVFQKLGYRVKKAVPVDMFPNTEAIETVCLIVRE